MNGKMVRRLELASTEYWTLVACTVVGAVIAGTGMIAAPARTWASWLIVSYVALGMGLAGLCFVAVHYTTGAGWSVAIRRAPEALAGTLPYTTALLIVALLAHPRLYQWTFDPIDPANTAMTFKRWWLSRPFFLVRAGGYCLLWIAFAQAIRSRSARQDQDADARWTAANRRWAAGFLVVFGVTFTLASFDWIMSLEPFWYSTIFSVYNFAGLFLGGLSAIILLVLWLERRGPLQGILNDEHLHDLAKLLFAFSTFWMYIWFSQYMLIWYTDIPVEASHFARRTAAGWAPLFVVNVALNWTMPFLLLLRRNAKRLRSLVGRVAVIVLLGRWVDVYLMIYPALLGDRPHLGIWEIGLTVGGLGFFGLALARCLGAAQTVPVGDPQLTESLQYQH
jgi:hypothetical protein